MKMGCFDYILATVQAAFIVLKICGKITLSWFAIFIPVYIWLGLVVIGVTIEVLKDKYK